MQWSPPEEMAGRLAFDDWRYSLYYLPCWDWGDMTTAERQRWVEQARCGTGPPDEWSFTELRDRG